MKIQNKKELTELLGAANLSICHTRTSGVNAFTLVNECYGEFTVNFAPYQNLDKIREFVGQFKNLSFTVNH